MGTIAAIVGGCVALAIIAAIIFANNSHPPKTRAVEMKESEDDYVEELPANFVHTAPPMVYSVVPTQQPLYPMPQSSVIIRR
jgi:hypothetical protein